MNSLRARTGPSRRCRNAPPPSSPTLISVMPNRACSAATMKSDTATNTMPAPRAGPLTAAITGTSQS